jgi:hypothetical protein
MAARGIQHERPLPLKLFESDAEWDAFMTMIREADYSGAKPALRSTIRRGENAAVDAVLDRLQAARLATGNVIRSEGQDAAAGYVAPMPVPPRALGVVVTNRVQVSDLGVAVTVKEAPAKQAADGPRNFAKEKGEIWTRMFDEYPDDPPGTVRINPEAQVELFALEEEERKVGGDGPLSRPEIPMPAERAAVRSAIRPAAGAAAGSASEMPAAEADAYPEVTPAAEMDLHQHVTPAAEMDVHQEVTPASMAPASAPPSGVAAERAQSHPSRKGRLAAGLVAAALAVVLLAAIARRKEPRDAATEGPALSPVPASAKAPASPGREADAGASGETNPIEPTPSERSVETNREGGGTPEKGDAKAAEAVKPRPDEKKVRGAASPAAPQLESGSPIRGGPAMQPEKKPSPMPKDQSFPKEPQPSSPAPVSSASEGSWF